MDIFHVKETLELESGNCIEGVEIAYRTFGKTGSPVIWICHALTANADPEEWWPGMTGKDKLFDPKKYFIVCANILGSCYGSTFAGSINPVTGEAYGESFPLLTVKDQVKTLSLLRTYLGIDKIELAVGASLGGQQVVEWAITEPAVFHKICLIATNARHSPWGIAFNEAQRMALLADPSLYSSEPDRGWKGLAAARAIAMLSYRNYKAYESTQLDDIEVYQYHKAGSYQQYQGEKLCKRFHPWAYMTLSRMMDSHNVGRGRDSLEKALSEITARTLVIGIESDLLFPVTEQQFLSNRISGAFLKIVNSKFGHDGFLIENDILTQIIGEFLEENY